MKNPAHLDNFLANPLLDRFAIVEVYKDAFGATKYLEWASAKSVEDAKARFYSRFMYRGPIDREMMMNASRHGRLNVVKRVRGFSDEIIEHKAMLLA